MPRPGAPLKRSAARATSGSDVVEEDHVERVLRPLAHRAVALDEVGDGLRVTRVLPPLAGGLAGRGNHRREQHEQRCADLLGHERAGESAERLSDDHHVAVGWRRARYRRGVVAGTRFGVLKRQRRGEGVVAKPAQLVDRRPIDLWVRSGARDEDERGYRRSLLKSAASLPPRNTERAPSRGLGVSAGVGSKGPAS